MRKVIKYTILSFICIFVFTLAVSAADQTYHIYDNEGLLTSEEEQTLSTVIKEIETEYKLDVVILTESSGYDPEYTATRFYERNGFSKNGLILFVSSNSRTYYIGTYGETEKIFNSSSLDEIEDELKTDMRAEKYALAAAHFLANSKSTFQSRAKVVDGQLVKKTTFGEVFIQVLIITAISLALAGLVLSVFVKKMNNARPQKTAANYVTDFDLAVSRDLYLYSTVSRVPRQTSKSSGGRSGGGYSHGGRGGRF